MARQGRFGRATAGSQNLSALIYSLLREERNDQEDTMIRSYRNNMRGGVSTNTFSSGGTTTSATAASVYQWYLSQAELAKQSGDNVGYNSLIQRAEEFRIAALGDQETLLSTAFANGTNIDFSLFGGTGSGQLSLSQFESLMTNLANNPSLTDSDRSRIRLTLFTQQLNSTAGSLGREYDEGTKSANDLVAFYDKELERARAAGITTDSQLYQSMLNARSKYVKAGQVDAANARVEAVNKGIQDEALSLAKAMQTFLSPIIDKRFKSQATIDALKAPITKDGFAYIDKLVTALGEGNTNLYQLIYDAAVAGGYGQEQIDSMLQSASVFSAEALRLAKLYPNEAGKISQFALQLSEAAAYGGFQAAGRSAATTFQDAIAASGGAVGVAASSDPYATANALRTYARDVSVISTNPNYDEVNIAEAAFQYASGNLGLGSGDGGVAAIIDELSKTYANYDKQNIVIALANLLSGSENAWQSNDPLYKTVGRWIQNNGLEANDLLSPIDPTIGGLTIGQLMQYAVESEIVKMVDADPNLVYAYQFDKTLGTAVFQPVSVAQVKGDDSYMAYTSTGKGQEIVYIQRIKLKVNGGGESSIYLVPMPGGEGTFSAGATGDMDSNDYLEFMVGTSTVRLTLQDLQDIETYSGVVIAPPSIATDGTGTVLIDPNAERALTGAGMGSPVITWLYNESTDRGEDWFNSKFIANKDATGSNSAIDQLVSSYVKKITPLAQARGETVDITTIVQEVLTQEGINDKTGRLTTLIVSQIDPVVYTDKERRAWWSQFANLGGRGGGPPAGVVPPWEDGGVSWKKYTEGLGGGRAGAGVDPSMFPNYNPGGGYTGPIPPQFDPALQTPGPVNLTPNVPGTGPNPNALPNYAYPPINTPQLGGDFFFRKINTPNTSGGSTVLGRPSKFGI